RPADAVHELAAERHDRAVATRADGQLLDRQVAIARGRVLLAPRERAVHRASGALRELGRHEGVLAGVVLRAEAAAHELADDANLVARNPELLGDGASNDPDVLSRGVDVERVVDTFAD